MLDKILLIIATILIAYGSAPIVLAQSLQSTNYRIDEHFLGPGGLLESTSTNYQFGGTTGDIGVGRSDSTNFRTESGFNTTAEPRLSVIVNTSSINFGALSTSTTATATATFSVLNYTAYGYSVFTIGNPPSTGGYTLAGMNPAAASAVGTEQYGINLKANTSPTTFGADPLQVPSSSFSYGIASTGYNVANNYRYVAGEKIAEAPQTSGQTNYTISYIVNVSTTTAGGAYSGSQSLVVVGTY
ncbi:TPA: hypothetical protein DIS56_03270 [Candidatus Saccharibacteria bacterium]|nr:MAG: hypothetical protein A3F05_01155 [Candidatus Saccharibacteria bacterium RIFCSPHIGHO2_12_FULL_47_17]HCM52122.1 hypothetical protein [Candidatus Saccharibacteria bacterium]